MFHMLLYRTVRVYSSVWYTADQSALRNSTDFASLISNNIKIGLSETVI